MMTQLPKDFQWRGPIEAFSWLGIEAIGDGIQLVLCVPRPVGALGQMLASSPSMFSLVPRGHGLYGFGSSRYG